MWVFTAYSGSSPTTTGLTVEINPADPAIGILIWVGELGNVDPTTASFFVQSAHGAFDAAETDRIAVDGRGSVRVWPRCGWPRQRLGHADAHVREPQALLPEQRIAARSRDPAQIAVRCGWGPALGPA